MWRCLGSAVLAGLMAGCGAAPAVEPVNAAGSHPENSILPVGSQAVIASTTITLLKHATGTDSPFPRLMLGVRVTVGHDPRDWQQTIAEDGRENRYDWPHEWARNRLIAVTVESGELAGASGQVERYRLRPIR